MTPAHTTLGIGLACAIAIGWRASIPADNFRLGIACGIALTIISAQTILMFLGVH